MIAMNENCEFTISVISKPSYILQNIDNVVRVWHIFVDHAILSGF